MRSNVEELRELEKEINFKREYALEEEEIILD